MKYFLECISRKFFDFNGRATQTEFLMFGYCSYILLLIIYLLAFGIMMTTMNGMHGNQVGGSVIAIHCIVCLILLILLIPTLAVTVRRLHDVGKSGIMILLCLIPLVGMLIIMYFCISPTELRDNKWGPIPQRVKQEHGIDDNAPAATSAPAVPNAQTAENATNSDVPNVNIGGEA